MLDVNFYYVESGLVSKEIFNVSEEVWRDGFPVGDVFVVQVGGDVDGCVKIEVFNE